MNIYLAIATVLISILFGIVLTEQFTTTTEPPAQHWCLDSLSQGSATISENEAGEYDYLLITTTKGIEVWKECQ